MDSGNNSGSLQSSSTGGDDEYDSRASAFLNSNPTNHVGPMPNPPQQHLQSLSSSEFQPSLFTNANSLHNLDMLWSKTSRSDQSCTDFGSLMASSSSAQPFKGTFQGMQIPNVQESAQRGSVSGSNDQNNSNSVARNPRKRSRASRRAPTTVLTTDTTNFRAMVQEFTGIPAPPFNSSHFPRSRLDIFGTSVSSLRSGTAHLDVSSPPYLLRPFAQKIQPPQQSFLSSSSSFHTSSVADASTPNSNLGSSLGYQIPSDFGLLKQQQPQNNLLNMNMQNHVVNFQSFLQGSSILGSKQSLQETSLGISSADDHSSQLGSRHGHLNINTQLGGLQNIVSSEGWSHGNGGGFLNGNYSISSQGFDITNGRLNNSLDSPSRSHHGDKGPENVTTRSEGIVESWICPSD